MDGWKGLISRFELEQLCPCLVDRPRLVGGQSVTTRVHRVFISS
jgi:hypothetical protein